MVAAVQVNSERQLANAEFCNQLMNRLPHQLKPPIQKEHLTLISLSSLNRLLDQLKLTIALKLKLNYLLPNMGLKSFTVWKQAGFAMLTDTQCRIIGIYKSLCCADGFYWRNLLYIAERVFLDPFPFFK